MRERLELSWERIRKIPVEVNRNTPHGVFFCFFECVFFTIFKGKRGREF